MRTFLGIAGYEYRMGVRRWGLWLAFLLAGIPFLLNPLGGHALDAAMNPWQMAASVAIMANLLLPVVAGIAMADRLERDFRLGVRELQWATRLSPSAYVLGKYVGAVLTVATPVLVLLLIVDGVLVATGAPLALVGTSLVAFLSINVVSLLFVGAFSLTCPLVMPVRVYQVLFTGYWFWGNFLSPKVIPTLSDTLLTPSGRWPAAGFFGMAWFGSGPPSTALDATANLVILAICAGLALLALERFLARQNG